jgi:hypothetical protein
MNAVEHGSEAKLVSDTPTGLVTESFSNGHFDNVIHPEVGHTRKSDIPAR